MPNVQLLEGDAIRFMEAVKRANWRAQLERSERKLELSMRKAFKEQGRVFVRGLRKFKDRFTEAAQVASHFGDDVKTLDESIPPTEWMFVFYESAKKTFGLFEKPIDTAAQESLKLGAAHLIAEIGMNISFDLKNPRAVTYLEKYGAAQVTKINETTREYLNTIMTQAGNEGWSYQRTAEAITDRFAEFAIGKPQAHIDSRAHLIAVTETGNAYAEGNLMVAKDLQEAGINMEKAWSTVGDDRVSAECKANEDQGYIAIDKPFLSGHQRPLRFPGCRCDLLTRVKN